MSVQNRRTIGFLLVPLFLVAVLGLWGVWSFLTPAQGAVSDPPTQLASVSVPVQPNSLAWSADGRYVAAGTWGSTTGQGVAEFVGEHRQDGLVVGCECLFAWYWLADLCAAEGIPFVLGHALYLKAIHGGKTKTDAIDARKLARLVRGGNFTQAYVYPKAMRATRDLLRRRTYLVRKRAELLAHLQMTFLQYNLTPPAQKLAYAANRAGLDLDVFPDPSTRSMLAADLAVVTALSQQIKRLEAELARTAKAHDPQAFHRLRTVPGIGPVLALILLYEVHDIGRFDDEGRFPSYARLVGGVRESGGKKLGTGGRKIGNAHLKWAFGEATCLLLRELPKAKTWLARRERKIGKRRALGALAARLARTVYHLWRKREAFDVKRFLAS